MPSPNDEYVARTPQSRAWFERAQRVLPGGVSYAIRDLAPYPFYVARAAGARLWDVDGNEYTDYWCGHGALILGHAPKAVADAVCRQASVGSHFGFAHSLEVELAEAVGRMVSGAEMMRYTNSGTEANMYALALARGFTGRTRVAKMEGGWHGGLECLNKAVHAPFVDVESSGLNARALEDTVALPFNDLDAAQRALEREDLACLFVEPMMGGAGCIPADAEYLRGLRELTTRHGTLLIFDEVITGFRLAPGGAQQYYGVTPDITTLGKILGGGFPIGAMCGRREIFERLDQRRGTPADRVFHGGTFSANPISLVAGLETLKTLRDVAIYERLDALGARMRAGLAKVFSDCGIDAALTGIGSAVGVHFRKGGAPRDARQAADDNGNLGRALFDRLRARGIAYLTPALPHMFISSAHTEADIDAFVGAAAEFAHGVRTQTQVPAPQGK